MNEHRDALLAEILAPFGVEVHEVLAIEGIDRGLRTDVRGGEGRVILGNPIVANVRIRPMRALGDLVEDARAEWMEHLTRAMREASLRAQRLGRTMRPAWSILVNPVTAAACEIAGIPAARLARTVRDEEGRAAFPPLTRDEYPELRDTPHYRRDGTRRTGDDYLQGQFLLNHADHVARQALQLLEDESLPIRSVSDNGGGGTMVELRGALPEAACAAVVGRPLCDVIGLPGFEPGTAAGGAAVLSAATNDATGRTSLRVQRRFVPASPPPPGADMRWVAMTPSWA